ncbi:hypothetical protein LJK88_12460 [Paenibacillus sp. P26]|nr:hypothetical protein LJK88_12460 [Paenibacillus sp. P26]
MAALCTGRLDMIARAMKDALHQPYRAPLVPGLGKILAEATEHGALGVALSGAGPTMLALVDRDSSRKAELERFMRGTLQQEGIEATTMWCCLRRRACRWNRSRPGTTAAPSGRSCAAADQYGQPLTSGQGLSS